MTLSARATLHLPWQPRLEAHKLQELPLQAGSLLCPLGLGNVGRSCEVGAEGVQGQRDIRCVVGGSGWSMARFSPPRSTGLGFAGLSPRQKGLGRTEGKGWILLSSLFCLLQTDGGTSAARSVVWFGRVFGKPLDVVWLWRARVGAADLDAVLCPGTGLVWPRAHFSTTLGHFFCSFASLAL